MGEAPGILVDFDAALDVVLFHAGGVVTGGVERVELLAGRRRVLASAIKADRDQPPFDRSTRDGFAVQSRDIGVEAELRMVGQVRAGERWQGKALERGVTIEIMTGAPMPEGADAVVMVEHVERVGSGIKVQAGRTVRAGENVVPRGAEAWRGEEVVAVGTELGAAEIALAAACGCLVVEVFRRPKVAIVATGDELVELDAGLGAGLGKVLGEGQIWNSNSYGIAAMVAEAGGEAMRMPVAADRREALETIVLDARGGERKCDLLILSGGVSMGEYDVVEEVLLGMGAEFFFTGVRMQPGKPVVFGRLPVKDAARELYFFGLPGNPVSTQVTFHCFVEPLLRAMGGAGVAGPRFVQATLAEEIAGKGGLMRVLPARLTTDRVRPEVRLVGWQGSGDLAANARANCYAVLPPEVERFVAGDVITVLLR